jgi:hypothetical protein
MFTTDYLLNSDWYRERLAIKQARDIQLWQRHASYIDSLLESDHATDEVDRLELKRKRREVDQELKYLYSDEYLQSLRGSIGADWIDRITEQRYIV